MLEKKPFFIGMGGSGMSSLAHILLDLNVDVSGYDKADTSILTNLQKRGARVFRDPEKVSLDSIDYIVYSSAVKQDHPVFKKAIAEHITLVHRSELLHELFSKKSSIAVAGSHGKTTTTAMTAQVLQEANKNPSIMLGGEINFLNGRGGKWNSGKWGVYESDESDGTFLNHRADIKIVTNIDNDHLDFYKTEENLHEAFAKFIFNTAKSRSIVYLGDKGVQCSLDLLEERNNIVGYAEKTMGETLAERYPDIEIILFEIFDNELSFNKEGKEYVIRLPFAGDHYLKNAFGAFLATEYAGVSRKDSLEILKNYQGVKRRLEHLGINNNVRVFDDYGHHPTEIMAVIQSIKRMRPVGAKCCIIFQPHRFTRTRDHFKEFASALDNCDLLFLLPIYPAGEAQINGISSDLIYDHLESKEKSILLTGNIKEDIPLIKQNTQSGDFLVSLGAGNVRDWALEFLV